MSFLQRVVRAADHLLNWLAVLIFFPLAAYGLYAIWDAENVNRQADAARWESYRPSGDAISFDGLRAVNPEVFGWISVDGTNIDYPLVQADDNMKYVNTDAAGAFSLSGAIFLDCRNSKDFTDVNNIVYGHHMDKNVMFGELDLFLDQRYFDEHRRGKVYYGDAWQEIEFFAFLQVDAHDPMVYNAKLSGNQDRLAYLSYVENRAACFRSLPQTSGERYIALSTCTSNSTNGRQVLIGRIGGSI